MSKYTAFDIQRIIEKTNMNDKISFNVKRPKVGEGTFKVKLFEAENTKSQKGNDVSKFTLIVENECDCQGGIFNHYQVQNFEKPPTEEDAGKFIFLALISKAYDIDVERCQEQSDDFNEFISIVTTKLSKRVNKEPLFYLKVNRKANGTDSNGNTLYKNYFSEWTQNDKVSEGV